MRCCANPSTSFLILRNFFFFFQFGSQDSSHLVDKVKVNWQYEEAKKK